MKPATVFLGEMTNPEVEAFLNRMNLTRYLFPKNMVSGRYWWKR